MKRTKILGLEKPDLGDPASPEPFNRNFDALEEAIGTFEYLAGVPGNRTTDTLAISPVSYTHLTLPTIRLV